MTGGLIIGVLDSEYCTNNRYIIQAICMAFGRCPGVAEAKLIELHTSLNILIDGNLDVLLVVGSAANVHWQMPRWRAAGVTTVFWSTEDPYEVTNNLLFQDKFDLVFTNDLASLPLYGSGAHHLPLAASLDHHDLPIREDDGLDYDILFVGTAWPNRVNDLNTILANIPMGTRLKIGLPGNQHIPIPHINSPYIIYDWRCTPTAFARLANRSKLTLTLGRNFSSGSGRATGSTPPPRVFELGLAGTAQVVISASCEIARYYDTDEEIVTMPSIGASIAKIVGLIHDPVKRHRYAQLSQARTRRDHTYDRRVVHIVSAIVEQRKERPFSVKVESTLHPAGTRNRNILLVAHNREGKQPGGGVEIYLAAIMRILKKNYAVYLLTPEQVGSRTVLDLVLPDGVSIRHETRSTFSSEFISVPEIEEIFFNIVIRHNIELVHFHHLLGLPLTLPMVAKVAGAQTVFTVHDYYLICDNFTLISHENRFCEFHRRSPVLCDLCLQNTKGFPPGSQAIRRNVIGRVLKSIDLLVFNTPYSRELARQAYEIPDETSAIIEMLMPDERYYAHGNDPVSSAGHGQQPPLRVKIPGNFTTPKAARSLVQIMQILRNDDIDFFVLGREDQDISRFLDALASPRIHRHRGYKQDDIPSLLAGGDVSLNFSIWPETFMISLSESWAAGLVPIVSDLGAPAERVTNGTDGFIVPRNDLGQIVDLLRMLSHDRRRLTVMKAHIEQKPIMRSHGHATLLMREYDRLIAPLTNREAGLRQGERLYFNRAIYAERFTNNKWTDLATLWDDNINHRHLGQGRDVDLLPQFPLSDVPQRYQHLPRTERDNRVLQRVKVVEDQVHWVDLRQERSVSFSISLEPEFQLVEAYLDLSCDQARVLVPIVISAGQGGDVCIGRAQFSQHFSLTGSRMVCVYDGRVIEHTHLTDQALSETIFSQNAGTGDLACEIVEGCDSIRKIIVEDIQLLVEGWAFDPVSLSVPSECYIVIANESGASVSSLAVRVWDAGIADVEPIYAYSGFEWSCSLKALAAALPARTARLIVSLEQRLPGRRLTSNATVELAYEQLVPNSVAVQIGALIINEEVMPALANALALVSPAASKRTLLDQMKLLVKLIDTRIIVSRLAGRQLSEDDRRHLLSNYVLHGEESGHVPLVGFEPDIYRTRNPEIVNQRPLLVHYWAFGRREGRVASESHKAAISQDAVVIRPHMDDAFYKSQAFGNSPFSGDLAQHYVSFGELNGLRPTPLFDPAYYRKSNEDLQQRRICLFAHYISFGKQEGRRGSENARIDSRHTVKREQVLPMFDIAYYTEQAPYLRNTDIDPICHFFEYGAKNRLSPNRDFTKELDKLSTVGVDTRFISWSKETAAKVAVRS